MSPKEESRAEDQESTNTNHRESSFVPPDGGWGWFVALGAFITAFLIPFNLQAFSIIYDKLFEDNHTTTATISWVFNLGQMSWNLTTIFVPTLCIEFGWRKVTFLGGVLLCVSQIITSLIDKTEFLFITFSLIYCTGAALGITVWSFIIPHYFEKRRGRVIGVITCGLCSGQFVAPLLVRSLQDAYGHKGAILINGGILLNVCVAAALYHPVEWHCKPIGSKTKAHKRKDECDFEALTQEEEGTRALLENQSPQTSENQSQRPPQLSECAYRSSSIFGSVVSLQVAIPNDFPPEGEATINKSQKSESSSCLKRLILIYKKICSLFKLVLKDIYLLRQMRGILLCFSCSLTVLLYVNFLVFIPLSVKDKGHGVEIGAYCLTVLGVFNVIIRIIVSSLTDMVHISSKWYFMMGCLVVSASAFAFASTTETTWLLITMGFYGAGIGSCICVYVHIIIETMGIELLPSTFGAIGFVALFLSPCIGPFIGYIRDATQDFGLCLRLIAALHLIPFLLWALMPLAIKFDLKRELKTQKKKDIVTESIY